MPQLIKKIQGEIFDVPSGDVNTLKPITGEVQQSDYININGLIAYLQNLSRVEDTYVLLKPLNFGLKNTHNLPITTLYINY